MALPDLEPWWSRDEIVCAYWTYAKTYAFKRWRNAVFAGGAEFEDVESATAIGLMDAAETWPAFADERNIHPAHTGGFWGYLCNRIDWEVNAGLRDASRLESLQALEGDQDNPPSRELMLTNLNRYRSISLLHKDGVNYISTLPTRWTAVLALRFFEQMPRAEIAELLGYSEPWVKSVLSAATDHVRQFMTGQVVDEPAELEAPRDKPWDIPQSLRDWTQKHYGADVHAYLGYVIRHYRADVSYLVDMLDRAAGRFKSYGNRGDGRPRKLTREQVAEICRRIERGETATSVAEAFGVSRRSVSYHYQRRAA